MAEPATEPADDSKPGESTQALADGLMSLLGPAVQAAENGALSLMRSQRELNAQLDAVSVELARFSSGCVAPPLGPHMAKLSELRQRMTLVNSALTSLQDRLERLYAVALPGARIGALAAAFNAARTPARQPVLRDEVPLSDPILPLPERVSPLVAPRTPQSAPAPPISSNVVPGTPSTALAKLRQELSSSPPPSSLSSFVSSAQHYDAAVSSSPQPLPLLKADPPSPAPIEEPR